MARYGRGLSRVSLAVFGDRLTVVGHARNAMLCGSTGRGFVPGRCRESVIGAVLGAKATTMVAPQPKETTMERHEID